MQPVRKVQTATHFRKVMAIRLFFAFPILPNFEVTLPHFKVTVQTNDQTALFGLLFAFGWHDPVCFHFRIFS